VAEQPCGDTGRPWRRALAWFAFLGPFFFLSYNFANWAAAQHAATGAFYFAWERHIPFLPWTIIPYLSINVFYAASLFICRTRLELDRHALRLLSAQIIAAAFFLMFPLHFAFERPPASGLPGALFDLLGVFDRPYNQAPSLHIALLVILWERFAAHTACAIRWLLHAWFALIGFSVLTTWQHHLIDAPTGALLGFLCLWLWPEAGAPPLSEGRLTVSPQRRKIAAVYLVLAAALALTAAAAGGAAILLWWGSIALALVAVNYGFAGAAGFQKQHGRQSLAVAVLLTPHRWGVEANRWRRLRRETGPSPICDGVWLGPLPSARQMKQRGFQGLVDLTSELIMERGPWRYRGFPWLDVTSPSPEDLVAAAQEIEALREHGPVLVACAMGRGRSAAAVAAWLLFRGRAASAGGAIAQVRGLRPQTVFRATNIEALVACERMREQGEA
jgi:protein-tyrosine phosphatase